MHQFWNTINKIGNLNAYNFKLDKKKCRVDTEVFHEILQICHRLPNQEFVDPSSEDELVLFIKKLSYSGRCEILSTIYTDQMHQPWRTFTAFINRCISGKTTRLDMLGESQAQILWGVVIKDTPDVSVSKKKAPTKADRGKGIELLSDVALLEDAQLKKALKKSRQETHKLQASGSSEGVDFESKVLDESKAKPCDIIKGTGMKPEVLDLSKADSSDSDDESWGNSEDESDDVNDDDNGNDDDTGNDDGSGNNDDDGSDAHDSESTDSDNDENPSFPLKDYKEEEHDEEYAHSPKNYESYDDKENVDEEEYDDLYKDVDVKSLGAEHEKEVKGSKQSSYVSSNFASKFLNLDNVPSVIDEVASMMNIPPKEVSDIATLVIQGTIMDSLENVVVAKSSSQPKSKYEAAESLIEFELKKILLDKIQRSKSYKAAPEHKELYQGLPKLFGKSTQVEEPVFKAVDITMQHDQESKFGHTYDQPNVEADPKHDWFKKPNKPPTPDRAWNTTKFLTLDRLIHGSATLPKQDNLLARPAFNLLKGTCKSFVELEFHFEEFYKAVNDRLDWHYPKGHEYPFDLSKPLLLIEDRGRQVVLADYFINNDLEYLKGGSSSRKYMTSTTKTKAAKYDNIKGIEDMVSMLWSPAKKSTHDVYSKKRIIIVTSVKVMKCYDYGYLEEIVVRREDHKLYKFKEGDFPRLNLCDIEDMLLLLVQKKLSNLEVDDLYDLGVALLMFTRHIVILHHVEDLQLGVKSYQEKHNITRPETFRSNITIMTPFTAYKNPQGIIYLDKYKRNRLMCPDELYKLCDGTLSSVRTVLNDIASNLRMYYLSKRKCSNLDRQHTNFSMMTLANKAILLGADNRPPMLEKDMYDSWKTRMELYMMNRQHGRMILESVENGLPPEVYALVSNHKVAKELWERIPLLMQGTSLMTQERECKLYDEFDKFAYKKGETLCEFYLRFSLLLNDINIYNMKLKQFQVNTKFLNTLPPEWSKFVTDVKLVQDLHTTNTDQLHAYLGQHEFHANEKGDDPIDGINHMMSFLTAFVTSRYPTTNNQLRNLSNPRQQATINNGRVTLQPIQRRHNSLAAGTSRTYTPRASGNNSRKQRTVICYNCKREGH
nr:hypothetical protein [Tanacetum cinerariifolium]